MITYDPRGMTWDQYCRLMAELFAAQQLGFVAEENWRYWVDGLNGIGYFEQSSVPDHRRFETWQQWAEAMCGIMTVDAR